MRGNEDDQCGHASRRGCAIENSGKAACSLQSDQSIDGVHRRQIETPMLLTVGGLIVTIAVAIIARTRASAGVNASPLGWMSDRWLAEQRAAHYH